MSLRAFDRMGYDEITELAVGLACVSHDLDAAAIVERQVFAGRRLLRNVHRWRSA
jgi:hypothetical protein